jgi:hypothetical protein
MLPMISCPHCKATLPDGTTYCQFCRNNFAAGTAAQTAYRSQSDDSGVSYPEPQALNLKWVKPVYYGVATWWVVNALFSILSVFTGGDAGTVGGAIVLLFSLFALLVGLGLIFKVELARGYVNIICWLNIFGGAFQLLGNLLLSFMPKVGIFGILGMIFTVINIALSVLMIFVIGETD